MVIKNIKWTEIIENESEISKKSAFYVIPLDSVTCKLVVVDDLGVTREISAGSGGGADRYVTSATFSTLTGLFTLNRSAGLPSINVNLDGRYLRSNQNITLSDEITGSGTTAIGTTAQSPIITNRPISVTLNNNSSFLYYDSSSNQLSQLKWGTISDYIDAQVGGINPYVLATSSDPNGVNIILSGNTPNSTIKVIGTPLQVKVEESAPNEIKVGLPDDVTINNDLVVAGNLYVLGTETIINTEELKVEDNIITVNSGVTGVPTLNAGLEVERGTSSNVSVIWNESLLRWTFTNDGFVYYPIPIPSEYNFYVHPTQVAINVVGAGLQFVQGVRVNTLGHTEEVVLGTIPDATIDDKGVVKKAKEEDLNAANTSDVPTVANVFTILEGARTSIVNEDDTLIVTSDTNTYFINSKVSTITEEFTGVQTMTLGFTPTNLIGVYFKGTRLNSLEFTITLPNQITIVPTVGVNDVIILTYQHLIV